MKHMHIYSGGGMRLAFTLRIVQRHLQRYNQRPNFLVGSSAGALAAAVMASGTSATQMEFIFPRLAEITPWNVRRILRELLEKYITQLPEVPVIVQCASLHTGRMVAVNAQDCVDLEDYHNLLASSCNIPLFMGHPGEVRVKLDEYDGLADGGIYDHLPVTSALPYLEPGDQVTAIMTAQDPRHRYPRSRVARQWRQIQLIWQARPLEGLPLLPQDTTIYRPGSPLPAAWRWGPRAMMRHMDAAEDAFTLLAPT